MTDALTNWHQSLLSDFSELGICYQDDAIAINPYQVNRELVKKLTHDLIKIGHLARKIAMQQYINKTIKIRKEYQDIIDLYFHKERLPIIMRCDAIFEDDQLKIIEMNVDSSIGGIWEMDFLQTRYKKHPHFNQASQHQFQSPKESFLFFIEEFRKKYCEINSPNLALIGYTDFNQFYKDQGQDLCRWITENTGFKAYSVIPELLTKSGSFMSDGIRNYHVLYRDGALVHSTSKIQPMIKLIKETVNTQSILLSDPIDLLIEHKGICALFYQALNESNGKWLTHEEEELLRSYIPETIIIKKEVTDLLLNNQNDYVIKKCFSHAGEHVYFGSEMTNAMWEDLVINVVNNSDVQWVAQKDIKSTLQEFSYLLSERLTKKKQRFTFNPFIFGNNYGGALIRIEQNQSKRVLALPTNSDMSTTGIVYL